MTVFSLIFALLIEQLRPLPHRGGLVGDSIRRISDRVADLYNDGREINGRVAWCVLVGGGAIVTLLLYWLLLALSPVLAFAFSVGILYFSTGFRDHGNRFSEVHLALGTGDLESARRELGGWTGGQHGRAGAGELARLSIEQLLVASHRNLFGMIVWFVVLPGPVGVVIYRLSRHLAEDWGRRSDADFGGFGVFARKAFEAIDWIPARVTALAFSVLGNFEDAIYCWRAQSVLWHDRAAGILIASGAGALGVRLGLPMHDGEEVIDRPEMGMGGKADIQVMQAAIKLVWRVMVLYVLFVALLAVASWVGS